MKELIKNRQAFTLLWLPILVALFYLEDKNKPAIEAILSLLFYSLIIYRLQLLSFKRKLFYSFIVILAAPFLVLLIGYIFNLYGLIFQSFARINPTVLIIVITSLSAFMLYCCLYAVFTKYNKPTANLNKIT